MNRTDHIRQIRANLAENEALHLAGKRSRKMFLACHKDGKRALAELAARKGKGAR